MLAGTFFEIAAEVLADAEDVCLKDLRQTQRGANRREAAKPRADGAPSFTLLDPIGQEQERGPARAGPAATQILGDGEGMRHGEITPELDPVVAADDAVDQKHHRVAAVWATGQLREGCREVWRDAADAAGVEFGNCFDRGFGKWHDACRGGYLSAVDQPAPPLEEPRRHPLDTGFERAHLVDRLKPAGTEEGERAVAISRLEQHCQRLKTLLPGMAREVVDACVIEQILKPLARTISLK